MSSNNFKKKNITFQAYKTLQCAVDIPHNQSIISKNYIGFAFLAPFFSLSKDSSRRSMISLRGLEHGESTGFECLCLGILS